MATMDFERPTVFDRLREPLFLLGIGLIVVGAIGLLWLAYAAVQIIIDPESIPVARIFLESFDQTAPLMKGRLGDEPFIIEASDTLRYLFFGALGLILVSVGASIANALIIGGIRLAAISVPSKNDSE